MQNFLKASTEEFIKQYRKNNDDEKYKRNKKELAYFLDKYCFKSSNDKEFYKQLFKSMDLILNKTDEEVFGKLGVYMDIPLLTKAILFLKYKEVSNYRDKMRMIKELCKDLTLEELLFHEKFITSEMNFITKHAIGDVIPEITSSFSEDLDIDILRKHLLLFRNMILIIKCVIFNHHKKELSYVEDGKPKFKIVPIKNIYTLQDEIKIGNEINLDRLIELLKVFENENNKTINSVNDYIAGVIFYAYLEESIIDDDYNKFLLDKSYFNKFTNSINSLLDSNILMVHSNLLTRRKVLIPKNGIIILVENKESGIESILLTEQEMLGLNNLCIITRYKDGTEIINSIILNKDIPYNATMRGNLIEYNGSGFNTLSYILDFFEIPVNSGALEVKYNVISPAYWKYRNKGYVSNNDKFNDKGVIVKREFEVDIAPFLRKINGEPGSDALKLADKLGVILDNGYTIVKPHTRTYNKVNK